MERRILANNSQHHPQRIVYGLGDTGLSIARYLYNVGDRFCVYDTLKNPASLKTLKAEMPDIKFFSGDQPLSIVDRRTEILLSPGVSHTDSFLLNAIKSGAIIKSDLDLFITEVDVPVIGITGSNGKSTVTEILGKMALESGFKAGVGGNLGPPALELLGTKAEVFILELSSFQLENSGPLDLSVAAILNFTPDHLDRHQTMNNYRSAKQRVFNGCRTAVINRNDKNTHPQDLGDCYVFQWGLDEPENGSIGLRGEIPNIHIYFGSEKIMRADEIRLCGKHNLVNSLAALAIGISSGFSIESMRRVLKSFSGLPHRCELISSKSGVNWINDSKATNVGATRAALEGLGDQKNVILIAGGVAKGISFQSLLEPIKERCKEVILIGESAVEFSEIISNQVRVSRVNSIAEAVQLSYTNSLAGDLVLLSPACSSLDMFRDYIDRGESFIRAVSDIVGIEK